MTTFTKLERILHQLLSPILEILGYKSRYTRWVLPWRSGSCIGGPKTIISYAVLPGWRWCLRIPYLRLMTLLDAWRHRTTVADTIVYMSHHQRWTEITQCSEHTHWDNGRLKPMPHAHHRCKKTFFTFFILRTFLKIKTLLSMQANSEI